MHRSPSRWSQSELYTATFGRSLNHGRQGCDVTSSPFTRTTRKQGVQVSRHNIYASLPSDIAYRPQDHLCCQKEFIEQLMKFDHVVFEICERTDGQTHRHAHHNISHPSRGEVIKYMIFVGLQCKIKGLQTYWSKQENSHVK